jgi:hypothetical protein
LRNAISAANNNAVSGACAAGQAAPVVDTIDFADLGGQPITLGSTLPTSRACSRSRARALRS